MKNTPLSSAVWSLSWSCSGPAVLPLLLLHHQCTCQHGRKGKWHSDIITKSSDFVNLWRSQEPVDHTGEPLTWAETEEVQGQNQEGQLWGYRCQPGWRWQWLGPGQGCGGGGRWLEFRGTLWYSGQDLTGLGQDARGRGVEGIPRFLVWAHGRDGEMGFWGHHQ